MTFEAVMLGAGATLGIDRDDSTLLDLDQFVLEDYSGLPDACEIARALDPNDDGSTTPDDGASDDLGNDGFTNKQEFQFDTDPHVTGDFPANFPAADPWALASLCALLLIAARRRVAARQRSAGVPPATKITRARRPYSLISPPRATP